MINVSTALPADYSDYAYTKKLLEEALTRLGGRTPVRYLNVHLHNMYGPGMDETNLVAFLATRMLAGEPVELSDCENSRDFSYIDVLVEALDRISASATRLPVDRPIEVGTGEPVLLRALVSSVRELTGSTAEIAFGARPGNPREPAVLAADPQLLESLGWRPAHSLQGGLRRCVEHLRESRRLA